MEPRLRGVAAPAGPAQAPATGRAAGLTTKDVTLVNLQRAEALAAFTSGSVEAWDIWPPYVQQVVAQNGARVLATGGAYGSPYSFEVASKSAVADPAKAAAIRVYLATLTQFNDTVSTSS